MSKTFNTIKIFLKTTDIFLWVLSAIISIFSLLLLLSVARAGRFTFFTTQLISIVVGYVAAVFISKLDYKIIGKYWYVIAGACMLLMIYTLFFGVAVQGNSGVDARAWITLFGHISFQPSELAKIGFIITFSVHLALLRQHDLLKSFINVALLGIHALVPIILTHFQGDDGAAIIFFFMFITMSFTAGIQLRYFVGIFLVFVSSIPILWNYVLADYQKQRILIQMNPEIDPFDKGYQQIQGKLSIGSGQMFGQGLFKGPRVAYNKVPIQESDFIFSVAGEELGFVGCIIILLLLLLLVLRLNKVAALAADPLGASICFGFAGLIAFQAIFNLGMCLSLLPVMGVTLPFFSAGGSSSACLYLGIGLIQSVYAQRDNALTDLAVQPPHSAKTFM